MSMSDLKPWRRVFVTGRGVLVGGLACVGELWEAVVSARQLPEKAPPDSQLQQSIGMDTGDVGILARQQLLALAATEQAWTSARLPNCRNRLRGEGAKNHLARFGCVSGTSLGGLSTMETELALRAPRRPAPYALSRWRSNSIGSVVSLRFGLGGCDYSLNAASATGAQILFLAASLIRVGMVDAVVAVSAEPEIPPLLREAMVRTGSVTRDPLHGPLSANRTGMRPVEAAACVILESASHAKKRSSPVVAEWLGGETANEAYHLLAPEPSGGTLRELLRQMLADLPTRPGSSNPVDWVSLHATGTPRFDAIEIACLREVFGSSMPWLTSVKQTTGHALGAAGLLDAIVLTEGLQRGEVPPWPDNVDPELAIDSPATQIPPRPNLALQIAQGMGGVVVVNAFGAVTKADC
jgi:3-oxoacyl-(acyl-carrier-protein) synthase